MPPLHSLPLLLVASALSSSAWADVTPNPLFSDGAVLQQGKRVPVWGKASEGEHVKVEFAGQKAETVAKDGKWKLWLEPLKASSVPQTMTITGQNAVTLQNVLVGEVWVCSGQSNMAFELYKAANATTEIPKANHPNLRLLNVSQKNALEAQTELTGRWVECSPNTVRSFSAVGYFFGRDILEATGTPVGMISSSVGGTYAHSWLGESGLEKAPVLRHYLDELKKARADYSQNSAKYADYAAKYKEWNETVGKAHAEAVKAWMADDAKNKAEGKPSAPKPEPSVPAPGRVESPDSGPTSLFNGMIAPVIPYAIKGAIWYQGESNSTPKLAAEYRTLFPCLIADWREKWGEGDFPFLFVQIAPYKDKTPEIREAQLLTWQKTPKTAMAVITDLGDAENIHPANKEPVGDRLALAARALAYGEPIEYSGPLFDTLKIEQNRAVLGFKHIGSGLVAKGGNLKGFTIAGADKKFFEAKAQIEGATVVVSSEQVAAPVAVRYGWANVPDVNLYNKEGLPASPFRTDTE